MIIDLYQHKDSQELDGCMHDLKHIQEKLKILDIENSTIPFQNFLERNAIKYCFPKGIISAVLSYILTITKTSKLTFTRRLDNGHVSTALKEDTYQKSLYITKKSLSVRSAVTLDKNARKLLSEHSIHYIQQKAALLQNAELLEQVQDMHIRQDRHKRVCLPTYSTIRVILENASRNNVCIILKIKRVDKLTLHIIDELTLLYKFNQASQSYKCSNGISASDDHKPAYIMKAVSIETYQQSLQAFKDTVLAYDLFDILLMNFAAHPQYASQNKHVDPPQDLTRETFKQLAHEKGFSDANPSLCLIYHAFADLIKHQHQ